MNRPEDLDRLQAYLDDELSPEETLALEGRLKAEPNLADALMALARDEAVLVEWAASAQAADAARAEGPALARTVLPGRRRRVFTGMVAVGALAAAVVLAVALAVPHWLGGPPAPPATALALLEEVQGEVLVIAESGRVTSAAAGQPLYAGQRLRTRGEDSSAVVAFADASRLELGGDTTIRLPATDSGSTRVVVDEGIIAGDLARKSPSPLVVSVLGVEILAEGQRFTVASQTDVVRVEAEEGPLKLTRKADGSSVLLEPGQYAVATPMPGRLQLKPLPARFAKPRIILKEGSGPVLAAAWAPGGGTVLTGDWDGTVKLWDPATGKLRRTLIGSKKAARCLAVSADGTLVAAGSDEKSNDLHVWDLRTGEARPGFKGHRLRIRAVAFAPDNRTLATSSAAARKQGEIKLWDTATGQEQRLIAVPGGEVLALAHSPDGRWLASGSGNGTVRLWDAADMTERHQLTGHVRPVRCVAFSPDGKLLASAGDDRVVRLWDVETGQEKAALTGHPREVKWVTFGPDSRSLATASGDPFVRLWDLEGRELASFKGSKHAICWVGFAPDGQTLAAACWDKTVKLWGLAGER